MSEMPKFISHVELLDATHARIAEFLSSHPRNLVVGERIARSRSDGALVVVGGDVDVRIKRHRARFLDGVVFRVEHVHRTRIGRKGSPQRHQAIVELVVAIEVDCHRDVQESSRVEVTPA